MADVAHILSGLASRHIGLVDGVPRVAPAEWGLSDLQGRLSELTASSSPAVLSAAMSLVRDAQLCNEPAVWITAVETLFFPPDAAAAGVDLAALTVVQVPLFAMAKAADRVTRSGGFGLVVLDMVNVKGGTGRPMKGGDGWLSRLSGLANRHDTAVLFLTHGDARSCARSSALGTLVSLRGEVRRVRGEGNRFDMDVRVVKDKRGAPGRRHLESCYGPSGVC